MDGAMHGMHGIGNCVYFGNIHAHVLIRFCRKRQAVTLLSLAQVIERAQRNNKVFGETHIYSTYPLSSASQAMISYKYIQHDSRCCRGLYSIRKYCYI